MDATLDFNGWIPDEQALDRGANSAVYRARREGNAGVLKICTAWKPGSERYQRFIAEIEALGELSDEPGVMRILDSGVPHLGKGKYPWYVMPEGIPLNKFRSDEPLDEVVPGLASIAETLQAMHARDYSHRDIKPSNLFTMRDGSYVVGDLGLAGVPTEIRQSLTREGGPLGPANFMAPEMLEYESGRDARPADVYSLAKSLWALVAKQNYPLPGHQRSTDQDSLVVLTDQGRASDLDRLIEAATEHDPSRRPTMLEAANGLRAWVEMQADSQNSDEDDELTAAIAEARTRLSSQLTEAESGATDLRGAEEAFAQLVDAMNPLFTSLPRIGASNEAEAANQMLDETLGHPFLEEMGRPLILWRNQVFAYAQIGSDHDGVRLAIACSTALYEGGMVASAAGILVYGVPPTFGSGGFAWHDIFEVQAGTLSVEQETHHLAHRAKEQMPTAIASFTELAEQL